MAIPQGTKLGRYEIRTLLGTGGMGEVYLANDLNLHRQVALKVLRSDLTINEGRRQRFEREAYAASSLNHPNILTIYEIGRKDSHHFIVTEFIEGESLGRHLQRGPFQLHEALSLERRKRNWQRNSPDLLMSWFRAATGTLFQQPPPIPHSRGLRIIERTENLWSKQAK